ncbi:hypothetical protein KA977_01330 [Candidatus Dependentiae bacterium]|nr:hypothetical protein [Candidatus Dependentiae bacterium]
MKKNYQNKSKNSFVNTDKIKTIKSWYSVTNGRERGDLQRVRLLLSDYDVVSVLEKINYYSISLFHRNIYYDENGFSTECLVNLARLALCKCQLKNGDLPSDEDIVLLCLFLNDVNGIQNNNPTKEEFISYFIRKTQFSKFYDSLTPEIARTILIFDNFYNTLKDNKNIKIDIPKEFESTTGLTIIDFIKCGFVFLTHISRGGIKNINNIKGDTINKNIAKIKIFFNNNSCSIDEFRRMTNDIDNIFAFNYLRKFPLIKLDNENYICPIINLLWLKLTDGIYYILLDQCKDNFTTSFGYLYEQYVGKILKYYNKYFKVIPEKTYRIHNKQQCKFIDWSIIDGDTAILFECKTKRLNFVNTIQSGDINSFNMDMQRGIIRAIKSLYDRIQDVKNYPEQFSEFRNIKNFIPVILLFESLPLIEHNYFYQLIDELLKKENIYHFYYCIMDINELEKLLPYIYEHNNKFHSLSQFFLQKMNDKNFKNESINNLLVSYTSEKIYNPVIRDKFEQIKNEISIFAFGESVSDSSNTSCSGLAPA